MNARINVTVSHKSRLANARHKRGYSLIELLSVMAFMGTLLSLAATTLHRAYQVHHTALKTFRELEQLNFWHERFLTDAHQAVSINIESDTVFSRADGQTVRYQLDQKQLLRIVEREPKTLSKETLCSPPLTQINWSSVVREQLPLVTCELRFEQSQTALDPIVWRARMPQWRSTPNDGKEDGHGS